MKVQAISNFEYEGSNYKQDQILEVTEEQAKFLSGVNAVVILEDSGEPSEEQDKLEEEDEKAPLADPSNPVPFQTSEPPQPVPGQPSAEEIAATLAGTDHSSTPPSPGQEV